MESAATRSVVWFLTGSQLLYGEETLRQVATQSHEVVAQLGAGGELPVRVEWRPVLTGPDEIRRACLEANANDSCIGVVAWMHTFSPAKSWIAGLDALQKPLLHLHTQANRALPWGEIDMDFMNLNQAAHGDREFGFLETRLGIRRKTVVGHVSDPAVRRRVGEWERAALGWAESRRLRVVRFGDNMRGVAVTEGDKVEAELRLGVSVNTFGVNDLVAAVEATSSAAEQAVVDAYLEAYVVDEKLRPGGERHQSLRDAARIECGLRAFLEERGAHAFTTNFEDLGGLRQLPGIAVQRLMAEGYGFGGEGDWKTSVLVRLLKVMAEGSPGGVSFMEDYTYDFSVMPHKTLGAHMLEVCPTIAGDRPRCEIHPLSIGGRDDPVRLVFTAAPGTGFVVGMNDLGDRFRLVANVVDLVAPDAPLEKLPVGRAVWEAKPDLATAAECWLIAGGPHHTALATAVPLESLHDFAEISGIELALIDESTAARSFVKELRWSDASYRLIGSRER